MTSDSLTLCKPLLNLLDHALEALESLIKAFCGIVDRLGRLAITFSDLAVCKASSWPGLSIRLLSCQNLESLVIWVIKPLSWGLKRPLLLFDFVSLNNAVAAILSLVIEIESLRLQRAAWIISLTLAHDRSCSVLALTELLGLLSL